MTCACCKREVPALIVWQSTPREDGYTSVKVTLCVSCSWKIEQNLPEVAALWREQNPLPIQ